MSLAPKLIYVVNNANFFKSHRLNIAKEALKRGFKVSVAAPHEKDSDTLLSLKKDYGFNIFPIKLNRWGSNLWHESQTIRGLITLYKTVKPDLVHHITIKPVIYGTLAARICGINGIVNAIPGRGHVFAASGKIATMRRYIVKALYRFAFSSGAKIIFQNDDDFRYFVEKSIIKKEQGRIIHGSGVNLQEFLPAEEPPLPVKILFSGRLLWNKGLGDLVVAAKHLRQKGLSFELYVAGELIPQNPGGISLSQIKEWERDGIIKNLGYRKDMPNLLQQVHIVCLPSFYGEGVPRALIEAAASGKAIVTTDAPGCRSIVKDGVNGFLVPPKDIERLSEALAALILDPVRRINFGVNGRNRVAKEGFSEEDVLKETFAIYEEILSRGTERLTAFNAN